MLRFSSRNKKIPHVKERTKSLALVFRVSVSYSGSREAGATPGKGIILAVHTVMFLGFERLWIFQFLLQEAPEANGGPRGLVHPTVLSISFLLASVCHFGHGTET